MKMRKHNNNLLIPATVVRLINPLVKIRTENNPTNKFVENGTYLKGPLDDSTSSVQQHSHKIEAGSAAE